MIAAGIGVPGLLFYLAARDLGFNTQVQPANLAENWWTIPVYVLNAAMNGIVEEVLVVGYLFIRLRQLGWSTVAVLFTSAWCAAPTTSIRASGGLSSATS